MSRLCRLKSYKNIGDDGKWAYSEIMQLRHKLAESQAREAKLRGGLHVAGMNCVDDFVSAGALQLADLPHDDTALKEYLNQAMEKEKQDA